jgi:hypothetical protein
MTKAAARMSEGVATLVSRRVADLAKTASFESVGRDHPRQDDLSWCAKWPILGLETRPQILLRSE